MTGTHTQSQGPPDPLLIGRLLSALGVSCIPDQLTRAHHGTICGTEPEDIVPWLRTVLVAAEVRELALTLLPWQRFDPARLPALIQRDGAWLLAESTDTGLVRLSGIDGEPETISVSDLDGTDVLWIRRPRGTTGSAGSTGNLASRLVWSELFAERGWLWQIIIATCLVNLIGVSTSLFAMQVYDRVVPTMAYATLTTLVAAMAIVVLLDWMLKSVRARILDSLACAVDQRLSEKVFEHLLHVQLDTQPRSLGTLAAQVGSLDLIRQFFSASVVFALVDLPFALMFLVFIAVIGGAVAWVYVLLLPAALILGLVCQWRLRTLLHEQLSRANERQGVLVDTIRGAESIRASNAGWRFAREWQELTTSINRYGIQQRAISSLSTITTSSLSTMAYVGAVVVGVWQIEAGLLTMGGLIACSILGGRIIAPVAQSVQYLVQWQRVRHGLEMVHQVLAIAPERRPEQQLLIPTRQAEAVKLEGIRFGYPDSPIRQLDIETLTLTAGDRVLLVGPVGAGKSTLLKIMAGLYRPGEGHVRLGDADLWETDPMVVSTQIGYLPQSVQLFRGTLRSNLSLAGTAGDDRILAISRELGIDAIAASNPLGMDLSISEGGEGLSGGQRQLVALARVFINGPRIWLLDEPTASLDRDAEQRVWRTLASELKPEDILVVSTHRPLPAGALISRVLVMQQGRVVRDGSPEVLIPQLVRGPGGPRSGQGGRADVV